jgi:hypothetical protein
MSAEGAAQWLCRVSLEGLRTAGPSVLTDFRHTVVVNILAGIGTNNQ